MGHFFKIFCRLDARSLALFRVGLGLTILCQLWTLWPDREAFLGEHGANPIGFFYNGSPLHLRWSFLLHGGHSFILAHLLLQTAFALMLMAGWRTPTAAFCSWILEISLLNRLCVFSFGADSVLVCYLMWAMFLPLGSEWSVDRLLANKRAGTPAARLPPETIFSVAAFCLIFQITVIYCMAGFSKTGPVWNKDYTALSYIFHNRWWATPLGIWLGHFPTVLKALTWTVVFLERFGVLFLLFPVWPDFWRGILVGVFLLFHLGMWLTMSLAWFPLIMIVGWMALVPSAWWHLLPGNQTSGRSVREPKSVQAAATVVLALVLFFNGCYVAKYIFKKNFLPPILYNALFELGIMRQGWSFFSRVPPPAAEPIYSLEVLLEPPELLDLASREYKDIAAWFDTVVTKSIRWKEQFSMSDSAQRNYLLNDYLVTYWNSKYPRGPAIKRIKFSMRNEDVGHKLHASSL